MQQLTEIINAWAEAYGVIADAFIGIEEEMYARKRNQSKADGDSLKISLLLIK